MIDWLIDWMINWLTDWLSQQLIDIKASRYCIPLIDDCYVHQYIFTLQKQ